jgi:hypothetical protein
VAGPVGWDSGLGRTGLRWAEIKLGQRVEGAKMNFRMLGYEEELGCLKRSLGCDMPKIEGAAVDFGSLGRKRLWAEKGIEKGNSFLFSENIFVKNKII